MVVVWVWLLWVYCSGVPVPVVLINSQAGTEVWFAIQTVNHGTAQSARLSTAGIAYMNVETDTGGFGVSLYDAQDPGTPVIQTVVLASEHPTNLCVAVKNTTSHWNLVWHASLPGLPLANVAPIFLVNLAYADNTVELSINGRPVPTVTPAVFGGRAFAPMLFREAIPLTPTVHDSTSKGRRMLRRGCTAAVHTQHLSAPLFLIVLEDSLVWVAGDGNHPLPSECHIDCGMDNPQDMPCVPGAKAQMTQEGDVACHCEGDDASCNARRCTRACPDQYPCSQCLLQVPGCDQLCGGVCYDYRADTTADTTGCGGTAVWNPINCTDAASTAAFVVVNLDPAAKFHVRFLGHTTSLLSSGSSEYFSLPGTVGHQRMDVYVSDAAGTVVRAGFMARVDAQYRNMVVVLDSPASAPPRLQIPKGGKLWLSPGDMELVVANYGVQHTTVDFYIMSSTTSRVAGVGYPVEKALYVTAPVAGDPAWRVGARWTSVTNQVQHTWSCWHQPRGEAGELGASQLIAALVEDDDGLRVTLLPARESVLSDGIRCTTWCNRAPARGTDSCTTGATLNGGRCECEEECHASGFCRGTAVTEVIQLTVGEALDTWDEAAFAQALTSSLALDPNAVVVDNTIDATIVDDVPQFYLDIHFRYVSRAQGVAAVRQLRDLVSGGYLTFLNVVKDFGTRAPIPSRVSSAPEPPVQILNPTVAPSVPPVGFHGTTPEANTDGGGVPSFVWIILGLCIIILVGIVVGYGMWKRKGSRGAAKGKSFDRVPSQQITTARGAGGEAWATDKKAEKTTTATPTGDP